MKSPTLYTLSFLVKSEQFQLVGVSRTSCLLQRLPLAESPSTVGIVSRLGKPDFVLARGWAETLDFLTQG